MGDGRYYTLNQFFTTVILTFLVIFLTASLALSYYRNKDNKSDRFLILLLLILDVIAILKFVEELYMHVHTAMVLRFIELSMLFFCVALFVYYLLTRFPNRDYSVKKGIHIFIASALSILWLAGLVSGFISGGRLPFERYTFRLVVYQRYVSLAWLSLTVLALLAILRVYIRARRRGEASKIRLIVSIIVVLYLMPLLTYGIVAGTVSSHLETFEILYIFLFGVTIAMILNTNVAYGITPFTFERIRSAMDDYVFVVDTGGKIVFKNDNAIQSDVYGESDAFDVHRPEAAFATDVWEIVREQDTLCIRSHDGDGARYFTYRYKELMGKAQFMGHIVTFVEVTDLMEMLRQLEQQERRTQEANEKLMAYKDVVYYLEKEKEINALLEKIIEIQDASMLRIIEGIEQCKASIGESTFAIQLAAVIKLTEANLNDVRKAVSAYRAYYGGNR